MPPEKRRDRSPFFVIIAPLLVAFLLGVSGITFGLPWRVTDRDERLVVESAVATFSGDWTPIDLRYPTFFIYTLRVVLEPVTRWIAPSDEPDPAPLLFAHLASRPTLFYVVGRGLTLAMGVATVAALAALGKKLIGDPHGWLPAAILAVTPVFAEFSRYAKVDVPLTLWTTLALLSAVRFSERRHTRDAVATALFMGFAIATKWTGVLLAPVVACVAFDRGITAGVGWRGIARGSIRVLLLGLLASAIVLLTTPHLLRNPTKAVTDASRVADHVLHPFGEYTRAGYEVYPEALAVSAFGAGFLLAAGIGAWKLSREPRGLWIAPIVFGLVYLVVVLFSRTAYERFLLPALPVFALLAALGIVHGARLSRRPVWAVAFVAFLPTAPFLAARVVAGATNADTRLEALELVERRVPSGESILLVGGERGTPPLLAVNASPFGNLYWINAEARLGKERYARSRQLVVAMLVASNRPSYWIDRAAPGDLEDFLVSRRPAAIVIYDPDSIELPAAAAPDYEPAVVFSPRWATWWRHTNAVVLRKHRPEEELRRRSNQSPPSDGDDAGA